MNFKCDYNHVKIFEKNLVIVSSKVRGKGWRANNRSLADFCVTRVSRAEVEKRNKTDWNRQTDRDRKTHTHTPTDKPAHQHTHKPTHQHTSAPIQPHLHTVAWQSCTRLALACSPLHTTHEPPTCTTPSRHTQSARQHMLRRTERRTSKSQKTIILNIQEGKQKEMRF